MTTLSSFPAGGIIESAITLFGSNATNTERHPGSPEGNKQERAMARRLEQLHTALGAAEVVSAKAANIKNIPPVLKSANAFGTGVLIMTAMLSALSGAGAMWLFAPHTAAPTVTVPASLAPAGFPAVAAALREPALVAPATVETNDTKKIGEFLDEWRNAWAQRDIASYLKAYSQQFTPADGNSREVWVTARTKKLSAGAPIDIQIRELGIERVNADLFKATFRQDYSSGRYREMARTKVLLITRDHGEWKIIKEWITDNKLGL